MSEGFHVCNRSRRNCPILVMCLEPRRYRQLQKTETEEKEAQTPLASLIRTIEGVPPICDFLAAHLQLNIDVITRRHALGRHALFVQHPLGEPFRGHHPAATSGHFGVGH